MKHWLLVKILGLKYYKIESFNQFGFLSEAYGYFKEHPLITHGTIDVFLVKGPKPE